MGWGGQGILVLARALAQWAAGTGREVITSETHGMAMRGGTVTASLKIGDFAGPLIPAGSADVLIGLDEQEARSHLAMLRQGGVSIVNAPERGHFDHVLNASGIARSLGTPGAANMVMLGLTARVLGIEPSVAEGIVEAVSRPSDLEANRAALLAGLNA